MEEFVILDPTGKSWHIPYSEVPAALEAGGQFASMDEYNRITQYQQAQNNLQQQPQSIEDVARLITGTPREVMKQSLGMIAGNVFGDAGAKIGYGAIPF